MLNKRVLSRFCTDLHKIKINPYTEHDSVGFEECLIEDVLEKVPLRGNLKTHLTSQGVNMWDYVDKKCKYHRRESGQGWDLVDKISLKYLGKTYNQLKSLILNKRLKYFERQSALDRLKHIREGLDDDFIFNIENKLELKDKPLTVETIFNPYRYRLFNIDEYLKGIDNKDYKVVENFQIFLKVLKKNNYTLEISSCSATFKNEKVKGYINLGNWFSNEPLVFVDNIETFYKASSCPLIFKLPSSLKELQNALKEFEFIGSKRAIPYIREFSYEPRFVKTKIYW